MKRTSLAPALLLLEIDMVLSFSLKPAHLKRYKDITRLLLKYGRADLAKAVNLDPTLAPDESDPSLVTGEPEQLADDLEALGPTFIKLGQLLSSRSDLLPQPYLDALSRLQDNIEPFSFAQVEEIVSSELGVRLSKGFREFDSEPLAAASLGQVHRAVLRDGREVAVKVQRPDIRQTILEDLEAFEEVAVLLDSHTEVGRRIGFQGLVEEFRRTILRELDYRREANNLVTLGKNLQEYKRIVVPQPIEDYSTSLVLTMEYVAGTKITDAAAARPHRPRRPGAGRGSEPGLSGSDPGRRLLPCRPAPGQSPHHPRRPAGAARPGHGGADRAAAPGAAPEAPPGDHRRARPRGGGRRAADGDDPGGARRGALPARGGGPGGERPERRGPADPGRPDRPRHGAARPRSAASVRSPS